MKLKLSNLFVFLILLCVFFDTQLYALIEPLRKAVLSFLDYYNRPLIGIIAIILFTIFALSRTKVLSFSEFRFIKRYLAVFILWIFIVIIYSCVKYNQNLIYLFKEAGHYFIVLLTIPFLYVFIFQNGYEKLLQEISVIVLMNAVFLLVYALIYNKSGVVINQAIVTYGSRGGNVRVGIGNIMSIVFIYYSCRMFSKGCSKSQRVKNTIISIICVLAYYYLDQSRGRLVFFALTFMSIVFFTGKITANKLLVWVAVVFTVVGLVSFGVIDTFIDSFSITSKYGFSTLNRVNEIQYYFEKTVQNPIFGIGIISEHYSDLMTIKRGPGLLFYQGDVGIFGSMSEIGIMSLLLFIVIIIRWLIIWKKTKNISNNSNFLIGTIIYICISASMQMITRPLLIMVLPIMMSIFEYENYLYMKKMKFKVDSILA